MSSLQRPVQSPYRSVATSASAAAAAASIHLRRPPDVEEALSSMLWTPYERTPTDTSSEEDDDERLNRRLCRSHTFAAMSDTATAAINASYFGDDLAGYGDATAPVATFVPFPTSANCCHSPSPATQLTPAAALQAMDANHSHPHHQHNHHKNYDSSVGNYRFSYPYYSPIPSLNKWWSAAAAGATDTSSTVVTAAAAVALPASQSDTEGRLSAAAGLVREPPSYESLYTRHTTGHRAVKALRPMLNTLKATISGVRHKQQSTSMEADNQDVIMRRAANERLVHSFTDDFIAESDRQHVVSTNVANDHHGTEAQANARSQQNAEETLHNNNNMNSNHHHNNNNPVERGMQNSEQVTQPVWPHETLSRNAAKSTAESRRERSLRRIAAVQYNHNSLSYTSEAATTSGHRSSTVSSSSSLNAATTTSGGWHVNDNQQQHQQQQALEPSSAEVGTPNNKCLAELERLYEEFRLSESLRELQSAAVSANHSNNNNNNNATHRASDNLTRVEGDFGAATMRLNVPAATTASVDSGAAVGTTTTATTTTTSSVFLTTTNSVTTNCNVASSKAAHPCQRQPSLTIQVNHNNNNLIDNNKNLNNNNNSIVGGESDTKDLTILNNNHGVSVVNCGGVASVSVNRAPGPQCLSVGGSDATKSPSVHTRRDVNCNTELATATTTSDSESVKVINIKAAPSTTDAKTPKPRHSEIAAAATTATTTSSNNNNHSPSRTFTSTECQTDDLATVEMRSPRRSADTTTPSSSSTSREQRRRERRERRHQAAISGGGGCGGAGLVPHRRHNDRHSMPAALMGPPHLHPHSMPPGSVLGHLGPPPPPPHHLLTHVMAPPTATIPSGMGAMLRPMLPDILNSHFPPPYSALPPPAGPPGSNSPGRGGGADGVTAMGGPPQAAAPQQTVIPGATLLTPVISTLPIPGATPIMGDGRFTLPLPIMRRSPSERSGKGCCGQWFAGPPLRALIAVVALGGVACALGGAALGATGLAGTPSSHLTAALLMIGVGVVLVTVSGAAWRMTAPGGPPCLGLGSSVDLGRCGRRPCSRGGGAPHGLLYPEFQHRPPPPSYQASMQEYRLRLLLLDRDRQNGVIRGNSPPPTYRSHAGSLLRAPLTTTIRGGGCGSSSVGGSEYSLPPSYRSRNTTPATVSSERSIETAPSGRLLANEDLPEPCPSGAEHLPDYDSIRLHPPATPLSRRGNKLTTTSAATTMAGAAAGVSGDGATSTAIIEVEPTANQRNCNANKEKLNPRVFGIKEQLSGHNGGKDLVTIVTISQGDSQVSSPAGGGASKPDEQIEILAHL